MASNPPRRVTAYEVALRSGVSQATVSYVLNRTPNQTISPSTRERVLAAVEELGYRPFEPARTLSLGHSKIVLFLIPSYPLGHVMSSLMDLLSDGLAAIGRTLVIYRIKDEHEVTDIVRVVSPVAVISLAALGAQQSAEIARMGVTVEVVDFHADTAGDRGAFTLPQEDIGQVQVTHLVSRGHSRMGYALPGNDRLGTFSTPRLRGAVQTAEDLALPSLSIKTVPDEPEDAAQAVSEWTAEGVTAICAYNDDTAVAILAGTRLLGLEVPRDIAVVGVDDSPVAKLVAPPLTTVRVEMAQLAKELVRGMTGGDESSPSHTIKGAQIVARAST